MTLDRVGRLREVFESWGSGDFRAGLDLYSDDVFFETFTSEGDHLQYRGPAGVREWMREFLAQWEDLRIPASRFTETGDIVLVEGEVRARGRSSGVPVEMDIYFVWRFEADEVVDLRVTRHHDRAYELAGLKGAGA